MPEEDVLVDWPKDQERYESSRWGLSMGNVIIEPLGLALVGLAAVLTWSAQATSSELLAGLARTQATLCVAVVLVTALHEFSHAAVARRYGFTVEQTRIGLGGAVEWYPTNERAPSRQIRNVVAAGPISHVPQIIAGVVAITLVPWTSSWFMPVAAYTALNLGLALHNFVPITTGKDYWPGLGGFDGHPTDGMIVRRLRQLRA